MSEKESLPIKIDVGLKAELTGSVPEKEMGRLANALGDALSPFTEGLGLVGDSIRAHRATQTIKRTIEAQQLINAHNLNVHGAPLKFISQWAESSSLEDDNNTELNSMWSHLLANASTAYDNRHLLYVNILKNMSGKAARLLNDICQHGEIETVYELDRDWLHHIKGDLAPLLEALEISWRSNATVPGQHVCLVNTQPIFEHIWHDARMVLQFSYPSFQKTETGDVIASGDQYHYRPGITEDIYCHKSLVREGLLYEGDTEVDLEIFGKKAKSKVWLLQATEIGIDLVRNCSTVTRETVYQNQKT